MSRFALMRLGLAALAGGLVFTEAPAQADPYFKFFWSQPDPPPPVMAIPPNEVRAILRREGARMIGAPRLRGFEIIATGRDPSGAERRFVLDAETGEVLSVKLSREAPERPRPRVGEQMAPGLADRQSLGPPVHPAGPLDADHLGTPPPPPPPEQVMPPPPPKKVEAPPASAEDSEATEAKLPDPDSALSPIKPQRPAGAPKVEKLPQ
jgi:hypothetical protein